MLSAVVFPLPGNLIYTRKTNQVERFRVDQKTNGNMVIMVIIMVPSIIFVFLFFSFLV